MTHAPVAEAASLSCRCDCDEPGLDELLADEIMDPVTRSTPLDRERLRLQLSEVALRVYIKTTAPTE